MKKIAIILLSLLADVAVFAGAPMSYDLSNIRVIDGDTIEADIALGLGVVLVKQAIRLDSIDAPEIHSDNSQEKAAGLAVKQYVVKRLAAAKWIEIVRPERDKYGRILAIVSVEGYSLENELLDKGYVRAYHGEAKKPWAPEVLQKIIQENSGQ